MCVCVCARVRARVFVYTFVLLVNMFACMHEHACVYVCVRACMFTSAGRSQTQTNTRTHTHKQKYSHMCVVARGHQQGMASVRAQYVPIFHYTHMGMYSCTISLVMMMMIAFITFKSSLVPLFEGL